MALRTSGVIDDLDRCLKAEQACVDLINEFLACHEFTETMVVFKNEIQRSNFSTPKTVNGKPRVKRENVQLLLSLFEGLDYNAFFSSWDSLIPEPIKEKSEYKKLTIYLYTFFVTLPYAKQKQEQVEEKSSSIVVDSLDKVTNLNGTFVLEKPSFEKLLFIDSPVEPVILQDDYRYEKDSLDDESKRNSPEQQQSNVMDIFKQFLSEHGSEFTNEPELLPYFALPFVENPRQHPTFTRVFEKEWSEQLKQTLRAFLVKYSCGSTVIPDMTRLCVFQSTSGDRIKQLLKIKDETRDQPELKDLKRKLHTLKRDHQKLVGVATELATALEKCVQGETVDLSSILSNCVTIFPDLFTQMPSFNDASKPNERGNESFAKPNTIRLDASKIKISLLEGSIKVQLLLLQALRMRLTRIPSDNERRLFLDWFCKTDILGLDDGLFSRLLHQPLESPHPLQQSLMRLTNALVTSTVGRSYLTSSSRAINSLMNFAQNQNLDNVTEEMLAAIFCKISDSERTPETMNSSNVIDWMDISLQKQLKTKAVQQVALLLYNLSNSSDSWCEKLADHALRLLDYPDGQVYVAQKACLALTNILKNECLNDYCKLRSLETKLGELSLKFDNKALRGQIQELIKLHNREIPACAMLLSPSILETDQLDSDIDDSDLADSDFLREKYSSDATGM